MESENPSEAAAPVGQPTKGRSAQIMASIWRTIRRPVTIAVLVGVPLIAWLCRFQLQQDGRGGTVRINRFSGEVAVVKGEALTILRQPSAPENAAPTRLKSWPPTKIEWLGTTAELATRWRAGLVDFRLTISPASPKIKEAREKGGYQSWKLMFEDSDGFEVFQHRVNLREMTCLTGAGGEVDSLETKSSVPLSHYDYMRIQSVDVGWGGWGPR
jgi:hypothetical protein